MCDSEVTVLLFQGERPLDVMREDFHKKIRENNDEIVFAIVTKTNNLHVGAEIYEVNRVSRNGKLRFFIVDKKYWGKGLATESASLPIDYAFNKLNLHRVHGRTNVENHGVSMCLEYLGFQRKVNQRKGISKTANIMF